MHSEYITRLAYRNTDILKANLFFLFFIFAMLCNFRQHCISQLCIFIQIVCINNESTLIVPWRIYKDPIIHFIIFRIFILDSTAAENINFCFFKRQYRILCILVLYACPRIGFFRLRDKV